MSGGVYDTRATRLTRWAQVDAALRLRRAVERHGGFTGETRGCGYCAQQMCVHLCGKLGDMEHDLWILHPPSAEAWSAYRRAGGGEPLKWPGRREVADDVAAELTMHVDAAEAVVRRGGLAARLVGLHALSEIRELDCRELVELCGEWDAWTRERPPVAEVVAKTCGVSHKVKDVAELVRRYDVGFDRERARCGWPPARERDENT